MLATKKSKVKPATEAKSTSKAHARPEAEAAESTGAAPSAAGSNQQQPNGGSHSGVNSTVAANAASKSKKGPDVFVPGLESEQQPVQLSTIATSTSTSGSGGGEEVRKKSKKKKKDVPISKTQWEYSEEEEVDDPTSPTKMMRKRGQSSDVATAAPSSPTRPPPEQPKKEEENADEPVYEEDFEEYADDFEPEEEPAEKKEPPSPKKKDRKKDSKAEPENNNEIVAAMNEENKKAKKKGIGKEKKSSKKDKEKSTSTSPPKSLDVDKSKKRLEQTKRSKVAQFHAKRMQELSGLVELDVSSFDMLDLPPLNEYEIYIRNFGKSNSVQAATQCQENLVDKDMQTDDWEVEDFWCQHPSDSLVSFGFGKAATEVSGFELEYRRISEALHGREGVSYPGISAKLGHRSNDAADLLKFFGRVSQVLEGLLEENFVGSSDGSSLFSKTTSFNFSEGSNRIPDHLPFTRDRPCVSLLFHPTETNRILVALGPKTKPSTPFDKHDLCSLLCIWNLNDLLGPQRIMICEGAITCCTFNPRKPYLIFGGTQEGALRVWDLRESNQQHGHQVFMVDGMETEYSLRRPTFIVEGFMTGNEGHEAPIRRVIPLVAGDASDTDDPTQSQARHGSNGSRASADASERSPFQVASVDEQGVMIVWMLIELDQSDPAGSTTDLGLNISGRVKLLKSSVGRSFDMQTLGYVRVSDCAFQPGDMNRFLYATEFGAVVHGARFREKISPSHYRLENDLEHVQSALTVEYHPKQPDYFLAGFENGSIALYRVSSPTPIHAWTTPSRAAVQMVRWSPHRPEVFFAFDKLSCVCVWDLLQNRKDPCFAQLCTSSSSGSGANGNSKRTASFGSINNLSASLATTSTETTRVVSMALSSQDMCGGGVGGAAGPSHTPTIAFAFADGVVELHRLCFSLAEPPPDETESFQHLVDSFF